MPRRGLSTEAVVELATRMLDNDPGRPLTLARVAEELGVRPPSLYNHVDGIEGLERLVAIRGIGELAEVCRTAVMGRSGPDALASMAGAYRRFALDHPGVYRLTQVARPGDEVYEAAAGRVLEPVMATLSGLGIPSGQQVHAARSVRSALHGFALLEIQRGFGLAVDVESSFTWLVGMIGRGITPE